MAFDKTQPTNTCKIRNLGDVIRPNWVAIEEGLSSFRVASLNVANRTVLGIPGNPAAIASTDILFSKSDASGNTQLYVIDPASRVTQITVSASPTSNTNGFTWLPGGMLMQWGHTGGIASNADAVVGFVTPFSAVVYNVQITGRHNGGEVVSGNVHTLTANNFTLRNTSISNRDFYWVAIGPKV